MNGMHFAEWTTLESPTCGDCEFFEPVLGGFCTKLVMEGHPGIVKSDAPACARWERRGGDDPAGSRKVKLSA